MEVKSSREVLPTTHASLSFTGTSHTLGVDDEVLRAYLRRRRGTEVVITARLSELCLLREK
jgi:hypothetical protein